MRENNSDMAQKTEGVDIITGDPKRAVIKMAVPMVIAMLLMSAYNLIDAVWVAGLGGDAIAAIGFITPFFMLIIGLMNGLGAGATSAISRRIGAGDKPGAENSAMHSVIICVIVSVIMTVIFVPFLRPLMELSGAGATTGLALEYGQVVFAGIIFMLFSGVGSGILRGEGDAKRTMYLMAVSAIMNAVLDPIFIYTLDMGIAGAAWATVISNVFVCIILCHWLFIKKNTYLTFNKSSYSPDRKVVRDILGVGLPASAEMFLISVLVIVLNGIFVLVSGTDAVAVYTSGWRVVMIALVPLMGIATALVTVAGAAFGAEQFGKMAVSHTYSMKLGMVIAIIMSIATFIFAPAISAVFTYSPESAYLAPSITAFLRVMCMFYLAVPVGIMSTVLFQAVGKGMTSFVLTFIREIVLIAVFAWIFSVTFGWGEAGVWWGIVAGNIVGSIITYTWAKYYISRLLVKEITGSSHTAEGAV